MSVYSQKLCTQFIMQGVNIRPRPSQSPHRPHMFWKGKVEELLYVFKVASIGKTQANQLLSVHDSLNSATEQNILAGYT